MAYIEIENLTFYYGEDEKKEPALKDVNLSIEKGSFTVILGHNGSGKSTLAKLLAGILLPQEGKITVNGVVISDPNLSEEALLEHHRRVGMVFQNPDNQIVATVVEEDVAFGPENLGVDPKEIRKRVDETLEQLGVREYARHSPSRLSGGQKQRVAIAGILAMQPECMIFDEATAMLDPKGRDEVMSSILRLNREMGITVLHITHNMEEALSADRVLVLDGGRIALDGRPEEVFAMPEKMQSMGLDVQQGTKLLYELKKAGVDVNCDESDPEKCAQIIYDCWKRNQPHS